MTYIFVGEQRSLRAITMGVSWIDGRLAAKQLFDAMKRSMFDPKKQIYCNILLDGGGIDFVTVRLLRKRCQRSDYCVIGLGSKSVHCSEQA